MPINSQIGFLWGILILMVEFLFEFLGGPGVLGGSIIVLLFLAVRSDFIGVYRRSSAAHDF